MADFPKRGEIYLVNFNPARGSEQKGIRPALIIQNETGNKYASTTIVASITTTIKMYPITVFLSSEKTGLKKDSMVNLAQILTIDKQRLIKKIGQIAPSLIEKVDEAIRISLNV